MLFLTNFNFSPPTPVPFMLKYVDANGAVHYIELAVGADGVWVDPSYPEVYLYPQGQEQTPYFFIKNFHATTAEVRAEWSSGTVGGNFARTLYLQFRGQPSNEWDLTDGHFNKAIYLAECNYNCIRNMEMEILAARFVDANGNQLGTPRIYNNWGVMPPAFEGGKQAFLEVDISITNGSPPVSVRFPISEPIIVPPPLEGGGYIRYVSLGASPSSISPTVDLITDDPSNLLPPAVVTGWSGGGSVDSTSMPQKEYGMRDKILAGRIYAELKYSGPSATLTSDADSAWMSVDHFGLNGTISHDYTHGANFFPTGLGIFGLYGGGSVDGDPIDVTVTVWPSGTKVYDGPFGPASGGYAWTMRSWGASAVKDALKSVGAVAGYLEMTATYNGQNIATGHLDVRLDAVEFEALANDNYW